MDLSLVRRAVVDCDLKVIGMLNDRDICMAAYTRGVALVQASVGTVMSRDVRACNPSDNIPAAAERMRERPIEDGELIETLGAIAAPTRTETASEAA